MICLWGNIIPLTSPHHEILHFVYLYTCNNIKFYLQTLKLSTSSSKSTTVGIIVNLMSLDVQRVQDTFSWLYIIWEMPIVVVLSMYFLWQTIGIASLAGLLVLLILIPTNGLIFPNKIREFQVTIFIIICYLFCQ